MSSDVQPKCTSSSAPASAGTIGEPLLQEVLDRLDVVIDLALDLLDPARVVLVDGVDELRQHAQLFGRQRTQLVDAWLGRELQQPGELHAHALADQAQLAEQRAQRMVRAPA